MFHFANQTAMASGSSRKIRPCARWAMPRFSFERHDQSFFKISLGFRQGFPLSIHSRNFRSITEIPFSTLQIDSCKLSDHGSGFTRRTQNCRRRGDIRRGGIRRSKTKRIPLLSLAGAAILFSLAFLPLRAAIQLPIEVLGPDGTVVPVTVNVPAGQGTSIDGLWMQV